MMEDKQKKINEALEFEFDKFGWGEPKPESLPGMMVDVDFTSDFRNLLISFQEFKEKEDLNDFLQECDSDRYLDLRRAYDILKVMVAPHPDGYDYYPNIDRLSDLAMEFSLCPIHFVDWAICFDDENPECDQVRKIFPNRHDT
jgi:hypothetical protein